MRITVTESNVNVRYLDNVKSIILTKTIYLKLGRVDMGGDLSIDDYHLL